MIKRFWYLMLFPAVLWGQYSGGIGDGAAAIGSNAFVSLNGPISLSFFSGGPGDGHSRVATDSYVGLNGPISQTIFTGGNGDGFGIIQTSGYYGMNGPIPTTLFKGGNGDGFTRVATADPYGLNGAIPTYVFKGGNGDGHGSQTSSDYLALNGPLPTFTYRGGNGDGFGYAATAGDVSLPVMFASMSAVAGDRQVELIWVTEAEIEVPVCRPVCFERSGISVPDCGSGFQRSANRTWPDFRNAHAQWPYAETHTGQCSASTGIAA